MNLAIITARGGSKRIPRKNIKDFCGKPIIAYSIDAALQSLCFDEVMVSTDDQEIADIASKYGAKVPFMRSEKNSNDFSTTADVIVEVLESYQKQGRHFDYVCCLYPTAPFVTPDLLNQARKLLIEKKLKTVFPVAKFSFPIQRALRFSDEKLSLFQPEHKLTRSQDLESAYHDAGQFYWLETQAFLETKSIMNDSTSGIVLSETLVQDIDNQEDWHLAEIKYQYNLQQMHVNTLMVESL